MCVAVCVCVCLRCLLYDVINMKKVTKWTPSSQSPPMFVSMILDPIWQLYDAAVRDKNGAKAGRMAVKLGLDIPPRELSSSDPRTVLQVRKEEAALRACVGPIESVDTGGFEAESRSCVVVRPHPTTTTATANQPPHPLNFAGKY